MSLTLTRPTQLLETLAVLGQFRLVQQDTYIAL
jgi:hypothetical protein